jgi:phosphatidylserine decarboxylase
MTRTPRGIQRAIETVFQQPRINFFVTNRVPRRLLTRLVGWFSDIEHPLVRDLSIAAFQFFAGDLHLHEARRTEFRSLHDCFVRELKDGVRPIDGRPGLLVSPCDGIVGAHGRLRDGELLQAKGQAYRIEDFLVDPSLAGRFRNGTYVTLRLTARMYHRFHAPYDCEVVDVLYVAGDLWNVNAAALARVSKLFCRNERAVLSAHLYGSGEELAIVAVGAILVGSICLPFLDAPLNLQYQGPGRIACRTGFRKGDEMGYFRHGSTIIVISTCGLECTPNVREGRQIRVGEPLLQACHHPTAFA